MGIVYLRFLYLRKFTQVLYPLKFAVVDIETTGLYHQGHGITEIAVVHVDGKKCELAFHSLINPRKSIPAQISYLTGIDSQTVHDAPDFKEIAYKLADVLHGRIFVAHNVNFDYNFLKAAFEESGETFKYQRFCTMRYSRKILTDLKSHRLKSVCINLNIENTDEHRAGGDAVATAKVLLELIKRDRNDELETLLKQNNRNAILPPAIDPDFVNALPTNPGVYYFYGSAKKPIYIGKAKNLKRRVVSHFTASGSSGKKQIFQREITRIDYAEVTNEYKALLLEDSEIKKYWPVYNKAQKNRTAGYAIVTYTDRANKTRLAIIKSSDRKDALAWFNSHHQAKTWLYKELVIRDINPERASMFKSNDFNMSEKETQKLLENFIDEQRAVLKNSFVLLPEVDAELPFGVVVIDGKYRGYGHFKHSDMTLANIESQLFKAPDSPTAKVVIRKMLNDEIIEKISLD